MGHGWAHQPSRSIQEAKGSDWLSCRVQKASQRIRRATPPLYLQAIAKETLSLHSPVPIFHRECIKDCKINGYDLQVKDRILINAYAIVRDPEDWNDPDKYCPERFLDNTGEKKKVNIWWKTRIRIFGSFHLEVVEEDALVPYMLI